ncbi:MAG: alpha/beta hydrolase fold domain-containing protein, partial [Pirellulaceae bacterium]|nr:alpha/beta hydrolase fold domain-containing protein [Pirellulaceae bacterium]
QWDSNNDGKLTSDELPKQARGRWERLDANRDGVVTREEFAAFRKKPNRAARPDQTSRRDNNRLAQTPPTFRDVKYGPHERNVLDFWQAESDRPTPVIVCIHGGGFTGGDKRVRFVTLDECLKSGISVAAITYRFSQHSPAPASFTDSARAIQFIRHKAKEWNVDPTRFGATGGSAGAGISLWLGFHDDMADPKNEDPVLRQSTRLSCMFVSNGQTSYDPRFIRDLLPGTNTYRHQALAKLFATDLTKLDELPAEKYRLFEEISPIHHLTKDDPPVILTYASPFDAKVTGQSIGIHHPKFGVDLKERMDKLGIRCEVYAARKSADGKRPPASVAFMKGEFGLTRPTNQD